MALFAKLYTAILRDPKLMRASRLGAKRLHLLPWLIVFAKDADDGGRLSIGKQPAEPVDIAEMIPCVGPADVRRCCEESRTIGVLEVDPDGAYRFPRWDRRQSKPSDQPDRLRERKERQRSHAPGHAKSHAPRHAEGHAPGHATPFTGAGNQDQDQEVDQDQEKLRGGWPARWAEDYQRAIGILNPGHIGKTCRPAVQLYGEAFAREVWQCYIATRPHMRFGEFVADHFDVRGMGPEDFMRTATTWAERLKPIGGSHAAAAS
jgi:hypothetical protein